MATWRRRKEGNSSGAVDGRSPAPPLVLVLVCVQARLSASADAGVTCSSAHGDEKYVPLDSAVLCGILVLDWLGLSTSSTIVRRRDPLVSTSPIPPFPFSTSPNIFLLQELRWQGLIVASHCSSLLLST